MNSYRKKTHLRQSAEQKRSESEEQLSLLQTITSELATAGDLPAALEVVLRDVKWGAGAAERRCDSIWKKVGANVE